MEEAARRHWLAMARQACGGEKVHGKTAWQRREHYHEHHVSNLNMTEVHDTSSVNDFRRALGWLVAFDRCACHVIRGAQVGHPEQMAHPLLHERATLWRAFCEG